MQSTPYLPVQNSPVLKKACGPQEGHCEQNVESKVAAKKWQVNSKNFDNDNSGEFGGKTWRRQHKFTRIFIIKIISLPSQPFLGRHLVFHIFFHNGLLGGYTLISAWLFLDQIITIWTLPFVKLFTKQSTFPYKWSLTIRQAAKEHQLVCSKRMAKLQEVAPNWVHMHIHH